MKHPKRTVRLLLSLARHSFLSRGGFRRKILGYIEKNTRAPFQLDIQGAPFLIHFDNETERKSIFNNYNLREVEFLKQACTKPGSIFVDIGANSGYFTQILSLSMPADGRVLAIEPNPQMTERLKTNLALVPDSVREASASISIVESAVGATVGSAQLMLPIGPNSFGGAYIGSGTEGVTVKISTLHEILSTAGATKVSALKIDIEGHEDRALKPFLETAPHELLPKAIVIEHTSLDEWEGDILLLLEKAGYQETGRTRSNALLSLSDS
ncbi:MAG: FkbM family methyltransferase [Parvibaculaceae bacterium]|nr:FkbM family methyltransferase [Parvibaculaceae bacterium]|tara:strand:+ start:11821 stop:12627 length:807 start_codon:yes stop_codon:yes gene_type:complete